MNIRAVGITFLILLSFFNLKYFTFCTVELSSVYALLRMALFGARQVREGLRIHECLDELSTDLAEYVAQLSELSVKERGAFAIALSGGSLIGLMWYINQSLFLC